MTTAMTPEERLKDLPCNGVWPMEIHAFDVLAGGPCGCGKYSSQWEYDQRERDALPPGALSTWRRGIWA
jgi:hypothetical protein